MTRKIQVRRGLKDDIPTLAEGELGFTTDTGEFLIGTASSGNVKYAKQNYVNVKDFGATGDGATDDGSAVQAAIDSLSSEEFNTVYFPDGTYMITTGLTVSVDNISFIGSENAIITTTGAVTIFTLTSDNILFKDLQFKFTKANVTNSVAITGTGNTNVTIRDCYFESGWFGADMYDVTNYKVIDCRATDFGRWAFITTGCNGLWYVNNKCWSNDYDGLKIAGVDTGSPAVDTDNIFVIGNECYDNTRDGFDMATNNAVNVIVANNNFHDNTLYGIELKQVYQGTVIKNVKITNNIIYQNDSGGIHTDASTAAYTNLLIENNTIENPEYDSGGGTMWSDGDGIIISDVTGAIVKGNTVTKTYSPVRILDNATNCEVINNVLRDNVGGIKLETVTASTACDDNRIENNVIHARETVCIYVYDSDCNNNYIARNVLLRDTDGYTIVDSGTGTQFYLNERGVMSSKPTSHRGYKGTVVYNSDTSPGMPVGWISTSTGTSNWEEFGQIGHRTSSGSPVGTTPYFVGEKILDTVGMVWYISVGGGSSNWAAINS